MKVSSRPRNRPLTPDELHYFAEVLPERLSLLWRLGYATGARLGELVTLHLNDLHGNDGKGYSILFQSSGWSCRRRGIRKTGCKGSQNYARTRQVYISEGIFHELEAEAAKNRSGFIFESSRRRPMSTRTPQLWLAAAAAGAGYAPGSAPTWHSLRHTYATRIAELGDMSRAQIQLGHAGPRTTARYAHISPIVLDLDLDKEGTGR